MELRVKSKLLGLIKELDRWEGSFSDSCDTDTDTDTDTDIDIDPYFPHIAEGIGEFIKKISLSEKIPELVELSDIVIQKAKETISIESTKWDENYDDQMESSLKKELEVREIGEPIGLSEDIVNEVLETLGYQVRSKKGWSLTVKGKNLGVQNDLKNGKSYIIWNRKVVRLVHRNF